MSTLLLAHSAENAHTPSQGISYLVMALYIVSFSLFIYGLMGLTGPKTAVRGNWIAAVGMGLAVAATLLYVWNEGAVGSDGHSTEGVPTINWVLIAVGLILGVALGIPPALKTKMTAMPQLVALFNGVGGGTVALIAWAEFIETSGFSSFHNVEPASPLVIGSLIAAIIGSVSFWGSLVAFAKLQEIMPKGLEKTFVSNAKLFQAANIVLLIVALVAYLVAGLSRGFFRSFASLVGLVLGAVVAFWAGPVVSAYVSDEWRIPAVLLTFLVALALGQWLGSIAGNALARITERTGPKISSRASLWSLPGSSTTVGSTWVPPWVRPPIRTVPPCAASR